MLSLQEISDRIEIQELIIRYAYAIDERNWNDLDNVFTPDAVIDYSAVGGAKGSLEEIKRYLPAALAKFVQFQHAVSTTRVSIHGDAAEASSILFNPMLEDVGGAAPHVFFVGCYYIDALARTPAGWRITHRREEKPYFFNARV